MNGQVVFTDDFGATHILSDEEAEARFGGVQQHMTNASAIEKKSFWQNLVPFTKPAPGGFKLWLSVYSKIFMCCTSPGVIFATLSSSIALGKKL